MKQIRYIVITQLYLRSYSLFPSFLRCSLKQNSGARRIHTYNVKKRKQITISRTGTSDSNRLFNKNSFNDFCCSLLSSVPTVPKFTIPETASRYIRVLPGYYPITTLTSPTLYIIEVYSRLNIPKHRNYPFSYMVLF